MAKKDYSSFIKDPTGKWRVNMEETYTFDKNDLTNWIFFDEILDYNYFKNDTAGNQ